MKEVIGIKNRKIIQGRSITLSLTEILKKDNIFYKIVGGTKHNVTKYFVRNTQKLITIIS